MTEDFLHCHETKKVCFSTEEYAQKDADYQSQEYHKFLRVYLCEFCGFWHLTSKEKFYENNSKELKVDKNRFPRS